MNFPGLCKLTLTEQALCQAIEGTLNAARKDGEDYVRVTEIKQMCIRDRPIPHTFRKKRNPWFSSISRPGASL